MRLHPCNYSSLAALLLSVLVLPATAQTPHIEKQKPIQLPNTRHLFIDDALVDSRSYVTRVMHQPVKDAKPALVGDQPWENWAVDVFGSPSIHFDQSQGIYRLWYSVYDVLRNDYYICYATSTDALNWTKPKLGIHEFQGSKENNIVNVGRVVWPNSHVLIDEHETDPARRYKSLSWDFAPEGNDVAIPPGSKDRPSANAERKKGRSLGLSVAFSVDGLNWKLYEKNPILKGTGDTHFIIGWDENYQKYVGYFRPSYAAAGGLRVIGFSTSDDFINWTTPEIILRPDSLDPITDEFYGMPVMRYQGKYIGFLWIYRNSPNSALVRKPNLENVKGTQTSLDTQLTYSADGKNFIRVGDRQPFLPAGLENASDRGMVTASDMLVRDKEIWIYYGSWRPRHNSGDLELQGKAASSQQMTACLGLAKLRLDGFVSLRAGAQEGIVTTRQFFVNDDRVDLAVNANASGGGLAVEILDDKFEPIPGFTRADAQVIREDSISSQSIWRDQRDLSALRGKAVRICTRSSSISSGRVVELSGFISIGRTRQRNSDPSTYTAGDFDEHSLGLTRRSSRFVHSRLRCAAS